MAEADRTPDREFKLSNSPQLPEVFARPVSSDCEPPSVHFLIESADIRDPTIWRLDPEFNFIVVHLEGRMASFESRIEDHTVTVGSPAPGETWIVPAGCKYLAEARGDTVTYAVLRIPPQTLLPAAQDNGTSADLEPRLALRDEFIYRSAQQFRRIAGNHDDISRMMSENITTEMSAHLLSRYSMQRSKPRWQRRLLLSQLAQKRVQEYVGDHLSDTIVLDDFCRLLGMTKHDVLRAFPASFGTTPAQYVIDRRLGAARGLLARTSLDITGVAMVTGFSSSSHLSNTFRKATGMTPREFRTGFSQGECGKTQGQHPNLSAGS